MFTYVGLPDPTKQFRLLSFDSTSTSDLVSCRLETYDIDNSPPYYAISYVYGNPATVDTVLVNGDEAKVNHNCWHALNQVRSNDSAGLFWVDSLCINQSDLAEKSLQVHRIAAIFSNAHEVWACFGAASDDSDFFLRTLTSFPEADHHATTFADRSDDLQRRTINWLIALGDDFGRFAAALKAFGSRTFFTRMWIYQEVFLASNMKMIFGSEAANMQALKDITEVCSSLMMSYRPQSEYDYKDAQLQLNELLRENDLLVTIGHDNDLSALRLLVSQLQAGDRTGKVIRFGDVNGIVQIQHRITRLRCQDPRDKIFAIINLFGPTCGIKPDYAVSCFELALRVLSEYATGENDRHCVELAAYLCENLQLSVDSVDYKAAMASIQTLPNSHDLSSLPQTIPSPTMLHQRTPWACQVLPNDAGQWTAPFSSYEPSSIAATSGTDNRTIIGNGRPVAITTCNLTTGDWIAPLSHYVSAYYNTYCLGVVFRLLKSNTYSIVGEVAFHPYCAPCTSGETCKCQFGPEFHTNYVTCFDVNFEKEELLLCAMRLRGPFETMRREGREHDRGAAEVPEVGEGRWKQSWAARRDSTDPVVMRISSKSRQD